MLTFSAKSYKEIGAETIYGNDFGKDDIYMKQTTVRMHMNPQDALGSVAHVIDKDYRDKEVHVSADGEFEIWCDKGVYEIYRENFEDSIKEYNDKQKRKDRKIVDENGDEVTAYIKSLKESKRGKQTRKVSKKNKDGITQEIEIANDNGQRILYELVVSAGNCNKLLDERGRVQYTADRHEIHPQRVEKEINKRAIQRFCEEFEANYQNFKIALCAYHADEQYMNARGVYEWGIEHAHIDFIPVADGYSRGLSKQAGMRKALEMMGFKNRYEADGTYLNAYQDFCRDAQVRFENILTEEYYRFYIEDKHMNFEDIEELEIIHPVKGKGKQNLDADIFRATKELENRKFAVEADLSEITEKKQEVEEEVKVAKKRLKKAHTEVEEAEDSLLDVFTDADECRADAKLEVAQMRQMMDEEEISMRLEVMKSEKRAREAERYAEQQRKSADADFEDSVKLAKELEKEAKRYIEQCYKEYDADFEQCRNLLTNLRSDISELEKSVDEIWDEDFKVDIDSELKTYLEGHCVVGNDGKQVNLYDDFVKKMEEKKRRSGSVGDSVKKIKEQVTNRLDGIDDFQKFLDMRCDVETTDEMEM